MTGVRGLGYLRQRTNVSDKICRKPRKWIRNESETSRAVQGLVLCTYALPHAARINFGAKALKKKREALSRDQIAHEQIISLNKSHLKYMGAFESFDVSSKQRNTTCKSWY